MELELQTAMLVPLISSVGYASAGLAAAQQRARKLAASLRVDPAPPLLRSLALSALTGSDYQQATQFGLQLRHAAERNGDDVLVVEAAYVLGIASFWQADFPTARQEFELAVERYRPADRQVHLMHYAQDPKVSCLGRLACTLWFLGEPEAARQARSATLAWAEEIEHPFSSAIALTFAALLALDMGDEPELREYTAALVAAGHEAVNELVGEGFAGYITVLDGDADRGIAAIRTVVERTRDGAAAPGQHACMVRVLLAACEAAGDAAAALAAADQLLDMGGAACVWEPEARRVRAAFTTISRGTV